MDSANRRSIPGDVPWQEFPDQAGDRLCVLLERKVPAIERVHVGVGDVALVGVGSSDGEKRIVPAPHDEHRRPVLAQIGLPFGIAWRVVAIVVEQLELDLGIAPSVKKRLIERPAIRADALGLTRSG